MIPPGPAPVEHRLDFLQRRVRPMGVAVRIADIGDHPVPPGRDREERQRTLRMPEHVEFVRLRLDTGEMNVRKDPVARQRIALELHPQAMTHRAMCAVAADQPCGLKLLFSPVRMPQRGRHLVRSVTNRISSTCRSTCTPQAFRCSSISRSVSLCGIMSA